ncbi:unnamed protein product [Coccothraustes coccothraustes]
MRNTRDAEIGKQFLYWTSFSLRDIVKQLFAKMRNTRNAKGRDPGFSISERRSRVSFWRSCAMEQTECSGRIGKRFLYWTSFSLRDIVKQLFAKMRNTRNAKGRDPGFSISERRSRVSFWRSCAMEQTECSGRIEKRFLYWPSFSLRDIVKKLYAKMRNTRDAEGRDPGFSIRERRSRATCDISCTLEQKKSGGRLSEQEATSWYP